MIRGEQEHERHIQEAAVVLNEQAKDGEDDEDALPSASTFRRQSTAGRSGLTEHGNFVAAAAANRKSES